MTEGMMVAVRVWRPSRLAVDVALSVAAALVTARGSTDRVAAWLPHSVIVPLAAGQGLLLLARRRAPTAVLAAVTLLGVFMLAVGYPGGSAIVASCCAGYALAVHGPRAPGAELAWTLRGATAVLIAAFALAVADLTPGVRDPSGIWGSFNLGVLVAASWVLGYALRTRRDYVGELRDRAARLEAAEGERAARAVVDERLRIARELHDVIGHSISLIAIQSEAAARCARSNPDAVPAFLSRISAASRQALAEMRHVLAVLRPDAEAELSPQPGLADLGELVARLNAGGLATQLDAEPMDLSPGVALTVYRIVQESLTNVLKHAGPGARAAVTVARSESSVRVSVHDDGAGPSGSAASTAHGIVGMCERAAVYGGTLRTGARAAGGFEVEALIPMREEPS
jgi:signal transduction histidine kinase